MFNGNLKAALSSLRTSKLRSLFTMLGIIIGITSVVTVVSLGEGLKHQLLGQIDRLGSDVISVRSGQIASNGQAANLGLLSLYSASTLTANDVNVLSQQPEFSSVAPYDFVTNSASSAKGSTANAYVIGTQPDMAKIARLDVEFGNFFGPEDAGSNVAVVGSNVAHNLFGEFDPIGEDLTINGQKFAVVGVLKQNTAGLLNLGEMDYNSSIFIPFAPAQALAGGHANILQILARAQDPSQVDQAISTAQNALLRLHKTKDFTVLKQSQLLSVASGVINTATRFISAVAAISLLVGGIGIMDIMLVSVSERTREIGLRKAIGATNRQILNQFLIEGLVLSFGGGIIGILLSLFVDLLIRLYTNWQPIINWPVLAAAAAVSVGIGIIFSAAPALKAARKNPIDALRAD